MGSENLRAEAIAVLEMAADEIGRDRRTGQDFLVLADRLRDPAVGFSPMLGHPEEMVRNHLRQIQRSCSGLVEAMGAMPVGVALDPWLVETLADAATRSRELLAGVVTYGEVGRMLSGSWRNDELSAAIQGLSRKLGVHADALPRLAGPADDGLRSRSRAVLAWAIRIYRPGSDRAAAIGAVLERVADPGLAFGPGDGDGTGVGFDEVTSVLSDMRDMGDLGEDILALERDMEAARAAGPQAVR